MTPESTLACKDNHRREALRVANQRTTQHWNGIEYVEIQIDNQNATTPACEVRVNFLCKVTTDKLKSCHFDLFCETNPKQVPFEPNQSWPKDRASFTLKTTSPLCPNFNYRITVLPGSPERIDPQYATYRFTAFSQIAEIDPRPPAECPVRNPTTPQLNYLARDYASLRQLLLDRLALQVPEWRERHVPDIGLTLVELFAYVGDQLAYFQDAVATEAYLNTARQRISVRRHARLVDYELHEGAGARTFVQIQVSNVTQLDIHDAFFITRHPDDRLRSQPVLPLSALENLPPGAVQAFEIIPLPEPKVCLTNSLIKNNVGLVGYLVEQTGELSKFLCSALSGTLLSELKSFASGNQSVLPDDLSCRLASAIRSILQEYSLWQEVDFSTLLSPFSYLSRLSRLSRSGCNSNDNAELLAEALPNCFNSPSSDRQLVELDPALETIRFYTWNQRECCLARGATQAVLWDNPGDGWIDYSTKSNSLPLACEDDVERWMSKARAPNADPFACSESTPPTGPVQNASSKAYEESSACSLFVQAHLQEWKLRRIGIGTILIFEEIYGPQTHNSADANPDHRHAVRLTGVKFCIDPVTGARLVEIEWGAKDALPFPLCISSVGPVELGCPYRGDISVARGNVVLADQGESLLEPEPIGFTRSIRELRTCHPSFCEEPVPAPSTRNDLFRPTLKNFDLTFSVPLEDAKCVAEILEPQTHHSVPSITLYGFPRSDAELEPGSPPLTLMKYEDLSALPEWLDRVKYFSSAELQRFEAFLPARGARFLQEYLVHSETRQIVAGLQMQRSSLTIPKVRRVACRFKEFEEDVREAVIWKPRVHLLDSGPDERHFVVEVDDSRVAHIRFGDGDLGRKPAADLAFFATYRRGNGSAGNIGADKIKHLVFRRQMNGAVTKVRNPQPARGGIDPETSEHARLLAPQQFRKQRRAITAEDYEQIVRQEFPGRVQQSRASLRWMGTWYEAAVAIDPLAMETNPEQLVTDVAVKLEQFRRIGHRLRVTLPRYVAVELAMTVCVAAGSMRAHVQQELVDLFSNRELSGGRKGFFHPDNFGFGDALYLSRIVALAKTAAGVENVQVTRFQRAGQSPRGELEAAVMEFGPLEIPTLDNDPRHPGRGSFHLDMRGAR